MYNEYIELSNKIEEIKNNWKENKVKQLIEVLDKVEYKEIIDELNNYLKEKIQIDIWNSNKNNFNILKQQNEWQNWNQEWDGW